MFDGRSQIHVLLLAKSVPPHATKALGGERRHSSYSFSTSALDGGEWSASRPDRALPPGKGPPSTHCTGGWVGLRAGLDTEVRGKFLSPLPGIEPRSLRRQARRRTLYWLSYPAPMCIIVVRINHTEWKDTESLNCLFQALCLTICPSRNLSHLPLPEGNWKFLLPLPLDSHDLENLAPILHQLVFALYLHTKK
jgi:hypothetical protein